MKDDKIFLKQIIEAQELAEKEESKRLEKRKDELFCVDTKWTLINEKVKARIPISVKERDYYFEKLK